jgi:hypothetical protein
VRGGGVVVFFGYEGEKGRIEGLKNLPRASGVFDDFPNIFSNDVPVVVKEV